MPSVAGETFKKNRVDVGRLAEIHTTLGGTGRGRRRDVAVLNKAAVIFVTACWESYVEDLLCESFGHMVQAAVASASLTATSRAGIRKSIQKNAPSDLSVWDGDLPGWKGMAETHMKIAFVKRWHTPSSSSVDEKFDAVLGLADLSTSWFWPGMSAVRAKKKLDEFIQVRGNIAHRVHHHLAVHKTWPNAYLSHVARLADKTDDLVRQHVLAATGNAPW